MEIRMQRVLQRLDHHHSPALAGSLFPEHDASVGVVSHLLKKAETLGFCKRVDVGKQSLRYWTITDAGHLAIK